MAVTVRRSGGAAIVAVVGPTASGKSELALDLARALGAEIVNTDAMQVYRGMDIGTAKLPVHRRRGVPHHLLDVLDIGEQASVAQFQTAARRVVEQCTARGVDVVLVGGSALYTRAVLDRFEFPGTDPVVRRKLEDELVAHGATPLHARLTSVDPEAAARIQPSNGRRIVRALEVVQVTGRPFSASLPTMTYHYPGTFQVGVDMPRQVVDARIEARVARMWEDGFVDEVRELERGGLRSSRTASAALGYRQVLAFLEGEITEEGAKQQTVRATRRFARRQDGWFRKDPRISWFRWDDPALLERVLSWLGRPRNGTTA